MFFSQPGGGRFGIIDFTGGHIVRAGAGTHATVIKTQSNQTGIAGSALQGRYDFIEHGPTLYRVRVADQRQATWLGVIQVQGFQLAYWAIDQNGGFTHEQGMNSVTSQGVDSSS